MIIGRVGFDEETRREPQAFAAVAVLAGDLIEISMEFQWLFLDRAALKFRVRRIQIDSSWLLQPTPV
jgi:hypothetical protein